MGGCLRSMIPSILDMSVSRCHKDELAAISGCFALGSFTEDHCVLGSARLPPMNGSLDCCSFFDVGTPGGACTFLLSGPPVIFLILDDCWATALSCRSPGGLAAEGREAVELGKFFRVSPVAFSPLWRPVTRLKSERFVLCGWPGDFCGGPSRD